MDFMRSQILGTASVKQDTVKAWRSPTMLARILLIMSSIGFFLLLVLGCAQTDDEYFKQLEREGSSQEQRKRQAPVPSYSLEDLAWEQEYARRER
jgi:hypothetical protein